MQQLKEIDINELRKYAGMGCSIAKTARLLGVSHSRTSNVAGKNGITFSYKRVKPINIENLAELLKKHGSVAVVADKMGVSAGAIYRQCRLRNLLVNTRLDALKPCRDELIEYREKFTLREIASRYQVSICAIQQWLENYDIRDMPKVNRKPEKPRAPVRGCFSCSADAIQRFDALSSSAKRSMMRAGQ